MKPIIAAVLVSLLHFLPRSWLKQRWMPRPIVALAMESLARHPAEAEVRLESGAVMSCNTADLIQRYLYVFGVWEPAVTSWFKSTLRPGDVVVDVGANIGYYSLLAGRLVGRSGTVVAFEPVPSIADIFESNLVRNEMGNVEVVRKIVSDGGGTAEIFVEVSGNLGHSATVPGSGHRSVGQVEQDSLDNLIGARARDVRLLKVDVEGGELSVLRGARRTLSEMAPGASVIIEVTPELLAARSENLSELAEILDPGTWDVYDVHNDYRIEAYRSSSVPQPSPALLPPTDRVDLAFVKRG